MVNIEEILDRVYSVAELTEEESQLIKDAISINSEKSRIEGDMGKSILLKYKKITSPSFILNDPKTKDEVFKRAQMELMPGVEKSTKKILKDLFGNEILSDETLDVIWKDPKNPTINNKIYHAGKIAKEFYDKELSQAKTGSPQLLEQVKDLQSRINEKQSQLDKAVLEAEEKAKKVENEYKGRLIGDRLIRDAEGMGADIEGIEKGFAYQLQSKYHWDFIGNDLVVTQKDNPELKVTDPNTGTTLTASQVIALEASPRIDRSGKTQKQKGNPPKYDPNKDADTEKPQNNLPKGTASYIRRQRKIELEKKRSLKR